MPYRFSELTEPCTGQSDAHAFDALQKRLTDRLPCEATVEQGTHNPAVSDRL
jgi:hypothetical protein